MNEDQLINKQTNKQTATRFQYSSLQLPNTGVERERLDRAEKLRSRDNWSRLRLLQEAYREYVDRHFPGNPVPSLDHWTKGEPLSEAAQEKLARQDTLGPRPEKCETCKGTGVDETDGRPCSHCGGHGVVYVE